jgi:hypothetical protein
MENVRALLLDLYEREGWKALDYDSWRHCIAVEFSISVSRAYQLLNAAQVDRTLSTYVETDGPIPDLQARELAPLRDDPEAVREVWAEVQASTNGRPTAQIVKEAVERRRGPTPEQRMAAGDTHQCEDCGEFFSLDVWHCPICAHHWADPGDDLCKNCLSMGAYTYRPGFIPDPDDEDDIFDADDEHTLAQSGPAFSTPPPSAIELPSTQAIRDAHLRADFLRCIQAVSQIAAYAPERVVAVLPVDDADAADRTLGRLVDWFDQFKRARGRGLRVVGEPV